MRTVTLTLAAALVTAGAPAPRGAHGAADGAATTEAAAPADAATPAEAVSAEELAAVTPDRFRLKIGNRMYPDWSDEVTVGIDEPFFLGDTEFTAQASEYLPDFRIGESASPFSASVEPNNPALHVLVFQDEAAVDSSWAFLNFPPHFSATSFFTFQLLAPEPEGEGDDTSPAAGGDLGEPKGE